MWQSILHARVCLSISACVCAGTHACVCLSVSACVYVGTHACVHAYKWKCCWQSSYPYVGVNQLLKNNGNLLIESSLWMSRVIPFLSASPNGSCQVMPQDLRTWIQCSRSMARNQFSSVPWPIGPLREHEGQFSRDPLPVFSAGLKSPPPLPAAFLWPCDPQWVHFWSSHGITLWKVNPFGELTKKKLV